MENLLMASVANKFSQSSVGAKRSKHDDLVEGLSKIISRMSPHEKLKPERQLAEEWSVSRMTLRRALEALQLQGRIYTIPSSGLFVAEPRVVKTSDATSLSEVMRHRGAHPKSKIHLADKIAADSEVAEALGVRIGHEVYRIEQTFLDDDAPMATETSYINVELARGLLEHDLTQSLSRILEKSFEKPIIKVKYLVRAVVPSTKVLKRLDLPLGSATLQFCARGITNSERVVFYVDSYKRGDKYDLSYEIELE
jgi:GntR family transcriptional regulator